MKKKVWIIFMSACSLGYAQMGVNTTEITSTLTVQGSISANYREITNETYMIQKDDYNISYRGNSRDGLFLLSSIEGFGDSFGRMYNIKNLSKDKNLEIRTLGNQFLQFGGEYPDRVTEFTIYPGQHMHVVANKENNWVVYDYNTYVKKKVKVDSSIAENSVVRLGDFSFRIVMFDSPTTKNDLFLQIRSHRNQVEYTNANTNWSTIYNDAKRFGNSADRVLLRNNDWNYIHEPTAPDRPLINSARIASSQVTLVTIDSTGELYRVTFSVFGLSKYIIIHVERLG